MRSIAEIDTPVYYLYCGNPFSYRLRDLKKIRKFESLKKQDKNHLLISKTMSLPITKDTQISIIIPVYNEEHNIIPLLDEIKEKVSTKIYCLCNIRF